MRLVAGLGILLLAGSVSAANEFGVLSKVRGRVEYKAQGAAQWTLASERMRINPGDSLRTADNAQAVIKLSARNFVSVGAKSEMTLSSASVRSVTDASVRTVTGTPVRRNEYNYEVDLKRGRTVNSLRGMGTNSNYTMKTPVAVAGIRGTVFAANVSMGAGNEVNATFAVSEGAISVEGTTPDWTGEAEIVEAGEVFEVAGEVSAEEAAEVREDVIEVEAGGEAAEEVSAEELAAELSEELNAEIDELSSDIESSFESEATFEETIEFDESLTVEEEEDTSTTEEPIRESPNAGDQSPPDVQA